MNSVATSTAYDCYSAVSLLLQSRKSLRTEFSLKKLRLEVGFALISCVLSVRSLQSGSFLGGISKILSRNKALFVAMRLPETLNREDDVFLCTEVEKGELQALKKRKKDDDESETLNSPTTILQL